MKNINWRKKLTSRKFWAAVLAVFMSLLTLFRVEASIQAQVESLGWGVAALVAYILGEGLVDAADCRDKEKE